MNNSKSMRTLLFSILGFFLIIMAGLVGLLYVRTTSHLMNYDISINRYTKQNKLLKGSNMRRPDAIFIGNSITEQWSHYRPTFMSKNNFLNRGIGSQTTPQLLLRFRNDVIELNPKIVVIGAGINDIAENTGRFNPEFTLSNIKSMVELAQSNNIKVILTSVLPALEVSWNRKVQNVPKKIIKINTMIKALADEKGCSYVDYYSHLKSADNGLIADYSVDGVHINAKAYKVMEPLIKEAIDSLLIQD